MKAKVFLIMAMFAVPVLVLALAGCSRQTAAPVAVPVHDTVFLSLVQHDSIYVNRWHTQYQRGDTIIVHDSIDRWRDREVHDTVRLIKEVPAPYPVEVEVERELSWWEALQLSLFPILLGFSVIVILYWLWRRR